MKESIHILENFCPQKAVEAPSICFQLTCLNVMLSALRGLRIDRTAVGIRRSLVILVLAVFGINRVATSELLLKPSTHSLKNTRRPVNN